MKISVISRTNSVQYYNGISHVKINEFSVKHSQHRQHIFGELQSAVGVLKCSLKGDWECVDK